MPMVTEFSNRSRVRTADLRRVLRFVLDFCGMDLPRFKLTFIKARTHLTSGYAWCSNDLRRYAITIRIQDKTAYPRDTGTSPEAGSIVVRSLQEDLVVFLSHEARHLWQFEMGM